MICPVDEESNCFTNTTIDADYDNFLKCLWNKDNEPTDEYIFFLINGSITTVLNCIVLVIAFLYADTRSKPSQMFVFHMTAADLIVGVIVQFSRPFAPCFPSYFCGPYYVLAWMCQMGSVFYLLFLNLDKFLSIQIPLRYRVLVTRRRVTSVAILCWVALFIICVLSYTLFLNFRDPKQPSCVKVSFDPVEYYAYLRAIALIVPSVCSISISAYIFIITQASSRRLGSTSERQSRMLMQRIFFVFSSTMWMFMTCLPYRIGYLFYTICTHQLHEQYVGSKTIANESTGNGYMLDSCVGEVGLEAMTCMFKLCQLGTIGYPIITLITQRQYRCQVVAAWRSVAKSLPLSQWCCPQQRREVIVDAWSYRLNSLNESHPIRILQTKYL